MKNKWQLFGLFGLVVATTIGCVGEGTPEPQDSVDETSCVECDDWEVAEPEGSTGDDVDQQEGLLSPCSPQPAARSTDDVPEIPDEVTTDECGLEEITESGRSVDQTTTWSWEGPVLVQRHRDEGEIASHAEFEFDDDLETIRRVDRTRYGADFHVTYVWSFDERQRLEHYRREHLEETSNGSVVVERLEEVEQQWDGDRLVARTEQDVSDDGETTEFVWDYDEEGRLVEGTRRVGGEVVDRAKWRWEGDRPASVTRFVEGIAVERQSWSYDDDSLDGREIEHSLKGLDEETEQKVERLPYELDSYRLEVEPTGVYYPQVNPWKSANAHLDAKPSDGCYDLPTGLGHGYPKDEDSYHLGWSDEEENPRATGRVYGYYGYGYVYGTDAWYGHAGIGTSWISDGYAIEPGLELEATLEYDERGRMVAETLEYRGSRIVDEKRVAVDRSREFDERGLERDDVTVESEGEITTASLEFNRRASGQLVERRRYRDGEPVARQHWEYDDERAAELEVHIEAVDQEESYPYHAAHRPLEVLLYGGETEMVASAAFQRTFDDLGRQTSFEIEPFDDSHHDSASHIHGQNRTTEWGPHGRVEQIEWDSDGEPSSLTTWSYDESGHLREKVKNYGANDHVNSRVTYVRDDEGRIVEETREHSGGTYVTEKEYAC